MKAWIDLFYDLNNSKVNQRLFLFDYANKMQFCR